MSRVLAFVVGLSVFVMAADLFQCSDRGTYGYGTAPRDQFDHVDDFPRSHHLRSHKTQKSPANHAYQVNNERAHNDFRSKRRHANIVPHQDASVVESPETGKGSGLTDYEVADKKKEFERILEQSERIRAERESKDDQAAIAEKKKGNKKKCQGYTCNFKDRCGLAPLNALSQRSSGSSDQTGRRAKKKVIDSYMINGYRQVYGEWPSYVRIETLWNSFTRAICGGTLISDRHVLTAAHCMYDEVSHSKASSKSIKVILGDDVIDSADRYEKIVKVKDVCVSKRYRELVEDDEDKTEATRGEKFNARNKRSDEREEENGSAQYDFAVLTLKEAINFIDYHQPSCLPEGKLRLESTDYKKDPQCYLVGSGATNITKGLHIMSKTVEKMRMRRSSCKAYRFGRRDESRECWTKAESEGDSCAGDSGGPILCLDDQTNRWSVVGLVSYGTSSCQGEGEIGWVGVYTRVTRLLPIIKNECGV